VVAAAEDGEKKFPGWQRTTASRSEAEEKRGPDVDSIWTPPTTTTTMEEHAMVSSARNVPAASLIA
jgi:hypothetical protein